MKKIVALIVVLAVCLFPLNGMAAETCSIKAIPVIANQLCSLTDGQVCPTEINLDKVRITVKRVPARFQTNLLNKLDLKNFIWYRGGLSIKPANPSPVVRIPVPVPEPEPEPQPTQPNPPSSPTPVFSPDEMQSEMLGYVNAERAKAGVEPLVLSQALCDGAFLKSKDMAQNQYFSHNSPTYGSPFEMMRQLGISYSRAGENIAKNISVKGAHDAFMNSSGHRANILNSGYKKVGFGFVKDGNYLYVTQWFTD